MEKKGVLNKQATVEYYSKVDKFNPIEFAKLTVTRGGQCFVYGITREKVYLGSDPSYADFILTDRKVAPLHLVIHAGAAGCAVCALDDLVVYVNNKVIPNGGFVLETGDKIRAGDTVIEYERDPQLVRDILLQEKWGVLELVQGLAPISTGQLMTIRKTFELLDEDKSNQLTRQELGRVPFSVWSQLTDQMSQIRSEHLEPKQTLELKDLDRLIDVIDFDGSGEIDGLEFLVMAMRWMF